MRQCGRGNALNGATFISTKRNREKNKTAAKRVNALNGATFISTVETAEVDTPDETECQCPEWGDLHFYPCLRKPA